MTTPTPWQGWKPPRALPSVQSQAVKWWQLISAMEDFSIHTGMGLADAWTYVHRGDYESALRSFHKTVGFHDGYLHALTHPDA